MEQRNGSQEGEESVRIHVGGLGPSVISSDLMQTFSAIATVSSVDIIRTKGRNFAYITFLSPSPQAIKRIFTLYNGCVWKGGRLKLEKAKQFYLDKLRQEWEERELLNEKEETEASRTSSITQTKGLPHLDQSRDLEIYFPGLRKVKKIPVKGLGKHKRSFERVDPLPCSLLELCIGDGDCNNALSIQGIDKKNTEITMKDADKINQFKKNSQRKRSEMFEMETQMIDIDEKDKPPSRKRIKFSREKQPANVTYESQDQLRLNIPKESAKEVQECPRKESFTPEKKVSFDLQSNNEVKNDKVKETPDTNMVRRENNERSNSDAANWFQKGSWKSLVGQTGRISFSVLG